MLMLDANGAFDYTYISRWTKIGFMPCGCLAKVEWPYIPGDLLLSASKVNAFRCE